MTEENIFIRLDTLLVEQGYAASRSKAQRWIEEGKVCYKAPSGWLQASKASLKLFGDTELRVEKDEADNYVSRGALKLKAAIEGLPLDVTGMTAIDVGASTGGFTDYLLQAGAAAVVCVDVGHGQLVEKLKQDQRVSNYEGINARQLSTDLLVHTQGQGFDLAVMDVSFISQTLIIPSLVTLLKDNGYLISLVKPQFEVGPEGVGKGGIVRGGHRYQQVREKILASYFLYDLEVLSYLESPIKGGDGNTEFLLCSRRSG
jgi:23S rRNA (cytidine1920-2'-O)/16S rRNA (cytidine1409-2'-O)-methyltransferase